MFGFPDLSLLENQLKSSVLLRTVASSAHAGCGKNRFSTNYSSEQTKPRNPALHARPDFVLKTAVCNGAELLLMTPDKTDSGMSNGSLEAVSYRNSIR